MENQTGTGYLKVRVTTVGRTIPISGAIVKITEYSRETTENAGNSADVGETLYSLRTDESGLTQTVSLPAPPASDSMKPGDPLPYALYNVYVTYDGYYPVEGVGVPIFDNIVAVQPIMLIPLSEAEQIAGANGDRIMIYETPSPDSLKPGGLQREDIGNQNGTISGNSGAELNGGNL